MEFTTRRRLRSRRRVVAEVDVVGSEVDHGQLWLASLARLYLVSSALKVVGQTVVVDK